jgi:putative transposase
MASKQTQALRSCIVDIAHQRRRLGYLGLHDLLPQDFPSMNHKRVNGLWTQANLAVSKFKQSKRSIHELVPSRLARSVNEAWSMDFAAYGLSNRRRLKY